jgi:hypothetical protein
MDTYTQVPQRVIVDLLEELSATSSMDAQNDSDVARSEKTSCSGRRICPRISSER